MPSQIPFMKFGDFCDFELSHSPNQPWSMQEHFQQIGKVGKAGVGLPIQHMHLIALMTQYRSVFWSFDRRRWKVCPLW